METSHIPFFFFCLFLLVNTRIQISNVWKIITIFRYLKAVERNIIPKRNYSLEGENGLLSHGSC